MSMQKLSKGTAINDRGRGNRVKKIRKFFPGEAPSNFFSRRRPFQIFVSCVVLELAPSEIGATPVG